MVSWIDAGLAVLTYVSTIVATLRAGSRVVYLMDHDGRLGVLDGPSIVMPHHLHRHHKNHTHNATIGISPIWELAYGFQQGVKLALAPQLFVSYDVRLLEEGHDGSPQKQQEPYNLSPFPIRRQPQIEVDSETGKGDGIDNEEDSVMTEDDELDRFIDEVIVENERLPFLRKAYERLRFPGIPSRLTHRFQIPERIYKLIPSTIPAFVRRQLMGKDQESDDEDDWESDDSQQNEAYRTQLVSQYIYHDGDDGTTRRSARVTAYAPTIFSELRSRFGISEQAFQQSIFSSGPFASFQSNSKGGGTFFFSRDGAYMIKTIKREEIKSALAVLPKYHRYMKRNGRRTLLTRFCGMYGLSLMKTTNSTGSDPYYKRRISSSTTDNKDDYVFIVMNSIFPPEGTQFISERYDLKGSTVGREASSQEKAAKGNRTVLKDLDLAREVSLVRSFDNSRARLLREPTSSSFMEAPLAAFLTGSTSSAAVPNNQYGIHIGPSAKAALLAQLRRDVKLLIECQVMDYSLLVGIVNLKPKTSFDVSTLEALERSDWQEARLQQQRQRQSMGGRLAVSRKRVPLKDRIAACLVTAVGTPLSIICAPALYVGRRICSVMKDTVLASIDTEPLPYYGAGLCGVDCGKLSIIKGTRHGKPALYYLGLIDFLQPWTTKKVLERSLKGLIGHDRDEISCVPPELYAERFIEFIDAHVS